MDVVCLALSLPTSLERMVSAARSHHAVAGTLRLATPGFRREWKFGFLAPGFVRLEGVGPESVMVTDGRIAWGVDRTRRSYRRIDPREVYAAANVFVGYNLLLRVPDIDYLELLRSAVASSQGAASRSALAFTLPYPPYPNVKEPPARDPIASLSFLQIVLRQSTFFPQRATLSLDSQSGLPDGMVANRLIGEIPEEYRYVDVTLDQPLKPADFRFVPPHDYRDAALPPLPPPGRFADPFPRTVAMPGRWSEDSVPSLRVGAKVRAYRGNWVFDLQARDAEGLDWGRGSALVKVNGEWHFAALILRSNRALVVFPKGASIVPPEALQVTLSIGERLREMTFLFPWKL